MSRCLNMVSCHLLPVVVDDEGSAVLKMGFDLMEFRSEDEAYLEVATPRSSQGAIHVAMNSSSPNIVALAHATEAREIMFDSNVYTCPLESI